MYIKLPMLYTSLYVMFFMQANPLLGQVGGGWALEISTFLGLKWHGINYAYKNIDLDFFHCGDP
jgi:hypothetical protein